MVKQRKNSRPLKWTWSGARFVCEKAGEVAIENQNLPLRYKRARYYSAQLGRFISRDPLGFVDGMSLYRAYFVPDELDPDGEDIRIDPGYYGEGKSYRIPPFSRPQTPASGCTLRDCYLRCKRNYFEKRCFKKCESDKKKFDEWYRVNQDLSWTNGLPDCPCKLSKCGSVWFVPWNAVAPNTGTKPSDWGEPTEILWNFHHGATVCIRSKDFVGHRNQCCYSENGELITSGSGQGSSDKGSGSDHFPIDVDPAVLATALDSYRWGCFSKAYLKLRPQIGAEKCK